MRNSRAQCANPDAFKAAECEIKNERGPNVEYLAGEQVVWEFRACRGFQIEKLKISIKRRAGYKACESQVDAYKRAHLNSPEPSSTQPSETGITSNSTSSGQSRTQAALAAINQFAQILTAKPREDDPPEEAEREPPNTHATPLKPVPTVRAETKMEPEATESKDNNYARDFEPMLRVDIKAATSAFLRVQFEDQTGDIATLWKSADLARSYTSMLQKPLSFSPQNITSEGALKMLSGIHYGQYQVSPLSQELIDRGLTVITKVYGHAIGDLDAALQRESIEGPRSFAGWTNNYNRTTSVTDIPYFQGLSQMLPQSLYYTNDDEDTTEDFLKAINQRDRP